MDIMSIAIMLLPLAIVLLIFSLTPFFKSKVQIYIALVMFGLSAAMFVLPNEWFMETKMPIIDNSIENIILEVLNKIKMYKVVTEFDVTIQEKILGMVPGIVKTCFVYFFFVVEVVLITLICFIIHLIKKGRKPARVSIGVIAILVISFVIAYTPIDTCKTLYNTFTEVAANGELLENYPELSEYEKEIKLLEEIFEKCEIEFLNEYSIFPSPDDDFIKGNHAQLISELKRLESLMKKVDSTGIEIIYENPNFRFKHTTENTFNFDRIKELIDDVSESKIYNNMALLYTNDILVAFEDIISDGQKDRINLQLSEKEFKEQYVQILELLKFVAEHDLARKVEDLVSSKITDFITKGINLLQELGKEGRNKLTTFGEYPIIAKIKEYKGFSIDLIAEIYACLQLYNSMDLWLSRYRGTELYKVAGEFLILKGVI